MKGKGGKTLSGRDIQIGVEKISYKKFGYFFSIDQILILSYTIIFLKERL